MKEPRHKPNDPFNCPCDECVYQSLRRMGGPLKAVVMTKREFMQRRADDRENKARYEAKYGQLIVSQHLGYSILGCKLSRPAPDCFGPPSVSTAEWDVSYNAEPFRWKGDKFKSLLAAIWQYPFASEECLEPKAEEVESWFNKLADEWEQEVSNMSSLTAMIEHPKYREIVAMKWPVVPFLINDLQHNKRFWFPALHEITGIKPFDRADERSFNRMRDAWLNWGHKKYKQSSHG